MNAQRNYNPAEIILSQLGGGNRLAAMIGAKHFGSSDNGYTLSFKFAAKARNRANYIKITLDPSDTYNVEFGRITNKKDPVFGVRVPAYDKVSEHEMIYADMLKDLIESETGLFLSLK